MPDDDNIILFVEDDEFVKEEFLREFDRDLQSLLHSYKNKNLKAIIFGRAQINSKMTTKKWEILIKTKRELKDIPVIIDMDFGHTTPIFTIPIGGMANINDDDIVISDSIL